jgi:nucleotide sugar dehydrogenase
MSKSIQKVSVIGLGYVGLPTYVAIHKTKKYDVVGYTRNPKKIKMINEGISPIEDKEVQTYLKKTGIKVTNNPKYFQNTDVFIICVPTPIKDDYLPDYQPIISATNLIAPYLKRGCHYVLESTVNPGTCEEIIMPILENKTGLKAGKDFNIAHCPERIDPGNEKWTIYNIPRNIGSIHKKLNKDIAYFYRTFIPNAPINEVSCLKVAEATKIVENTFRDINIAYVNELAQSFDVMNVDLIETLKAASNKPFAFMTHWPGCGVGGHCIAVDPYYLIKRASMDGFNHNFLKIAREINNSMPKYTIQKLLFALNDVGLAIKNTNITLLGLSYKPNIGDLRESPALHIKKILEKMGAKITVYDPFIKGKVENLKQAIHKAKAIVIATSHKEFVDELPRLLLKSQVRVIVDGRNCLDKEKIKKMNIIYKGIGR